jgi:hypothetical protein
LVAKTKDPKKSIFTLKKIGENRRSCLRHASQNNTGNSRSTAVEGVSAHFVFQDGQEGDNQEWVDRNDTMCVVPSSHHRANMSFF